MKLLWMLPLAAVVGIVLAVLLNVVCYLVAWLLIAVVYVIPEKLGWRRA